MGSSLTQTLVLQPPSSLGGRMGELALGHAVNTLLVWLFDYALYPFVIYRMGLVRGGVLMALISLVTCLALLWFYDWSKRDWLGIEAVKSLKSCGKRSRAARWTAWVLRRSDPLACVILSLWQDPFITTTYLRQGKFNGMAARDWGLFLLSWVIGNAFWIAACFTGTSLLEWLWRLGSSFPFIRMG